MSFEFATAHQIIFGRGELKKVGAIAPQFGQRALIVTGSGSVPLDGLRRILQSVGVTGTIFQVDREPDVPMIIAGFNLAKTKGCEFVIGFGGGSVLDAGKAIAAMHTNPGELMDYLEVVGAGKEIPNPAAPMIALPTTAGTGTEVTRNAVITVPEHHVKVSMRSLKMIPTVAIVDPELTYSMPPSVTASTGMDALTQVIEGYVSNRANPMTDMVCREGIIRGARSLLRAYKNGQDQDAREDMSLTSLFGGLALANGGLGAVHGFAGPIGGMFSAPHGVICASLLPSVMKYNVKVSATLEVNSDLGSRYQDIARWVTGDLNASIEDGVAWIAELATNLEIPGLRALGIERTDFPQIIEKSKVSSSMQKNPLRLDETILEAILAEAY
ncbi:MAG: iron-containing alcohol dehydrogenase [Brevefilum sp.]|nr:iron-containing alcohol dehydrogenase [Brevefilum sp.]